MTNNSVTGPKFYSICNRYWRNANFLFVSNFLRLSINHQMLVCWAQLFCRIGSNMWANNGNQFMNLPNINKSKSMTWFPDPPIRTDFWCNKISPMYRISLILCNSRGIRTFRQIAGKMNNALSQIMYSVLGPSVILFGTWDDFSDTWGCLIQLLQRLHKQKDIAAVLSILVRHISTFSFVHLD